jgi:hypothetical protein
MTTPVLILNDLSKNLPNLDQIVQIYCNFLNDQSLYSYHDIISHEITQQLLNQATSDIRLRIIYDVLKIISFGNLEEFDFYIQNNIKNSYAQNQNNDSPMTGSNLNNFNKEEFFFGTICTPILYFKLEKLTLVSILERQLLSTTHYNQLNSQLSFPRFHFDKIRNQLKLFGWGKMTMTQIDEKGAKNTPSFSQNYNKSLTFLRPTPLLTLLTGAISSGLIVAQLNNVGGDIYDETFDLHFLQPRDLPYIESDSNVVMQHNPIGVDDIITCLDKLIISVDATERAL